MYRVVVRIGYYATISNGDIVETNRSYAVDGVDHLEEVANFTHALMREALDDYAADSNHNGIDYLTANVYDIEEDDFQLKGLAIASPFLLLISKTPKFALYSVFNRRYGFILPYYKNTIQGDSGRFRGIIASYSIAHYAGRTYEYMNICTYVHIYRSNICSIEHTFGLDFKSLSRTYVWLRLRYIHMCILHK